MKRYRYLIAYGVSTQAGFVFGNSVISRKRKIKDAEDIMEISESVKSWNDFTELPSIMNYISMGRCRE